MFIFTMFTLLITTVPVISATYHVSNHSGSDYECQGGPNTTCTIHCDEADITNGYHFSCGDSADCYIYCGAKKCAEFATIDASDSTNLYVISSAQECLKDATITTPNYGDATFTMTGPNSQKGFKGMNVMAGSNAQNIFIDCDSPSPDKLQCAQMNVNATNAHYLEIKVSDTLDFQSAIIDCPNAPIAGYYGPSVAVPVAPCYIDASGGGKLTHLNINAAQGIPSGVWIELGAIGSISSVTINCENGQFSTSPFNTDSNCWITNSPTIQPTSSPTSIPTIEPTSIPTIEPTSIPTIEPTIEPTITTYNSTRASMINQITSNINTSEISPTVIMHSGNEAAYYYFAYVAGLIILCCCAPFCFCVCVRLRPYDIKKQQQENEMIDYISSAATPKSQHKMDVSLTVMEMSKMSEVLRVGSTYSDQSSDDNIQNWLTDKVELPQYLNTFINNGYGALNGVKNIDGLYVLELIGITNKQHQIKIMLEICKLSIVTDSFENVCDDEFIVCDDDMIDCVRRKGDGDDIHIQINTADNEGEDDMEIHHHQSNLTNLTNLCLEGLEGHGNETYAENID